MESDELPFDVYKPGQTAVIGKHRLYITYVSKYSVALFSEDPNVLLLFPEKNRCYSGQYKGRDGYMVDVQAPSEISGEFLDIKDEMLIVSKPFAFSSMG